MSSDTEIWGYIMVDDEYLRAQYRRVFRSAQFKRDTANWRFSRMPRVDRPQPAYFISRRRVEAQADQIELRLG